MLTSDKLGALDNMSMWMVNGDFKSCNKKRRQNKEYMRWRSQNEKNPLDRFPGFKRLFSIQQ